MPEYRRNRVPGGTIFFTVNLLDRRSDVLVTRIDILRDAVRRVRTRAPFRIDAWAVLTDHLHCVWTLLPGDDDFPGRWRAIKKRLQKLCRPAKRARRSWSAAANEASGSGGIGSTRCATSGILPLTWITRISTR
jgi:putative transposase